MFYRVVVVALIILGVYQIISSISLPLGQDPDSIEKSAIGLCTIFLGLLNFAYLYETPESQMPKIALLAANLLFIGFAILLVTSAIGVAYGYIALALSLINCIMVLNRKV